MHNVNELHSVACFLDAARSHMMKGYILLASIFSFSVPNAAASLLPETCAYIAEFRLNARIMLIREPALITRAFGRHSVYVVHALLDYLLG